MELLGFVSVSQGLVLLVVTLLALYWYMTRNYGMWAKQGVTEVSPALFFGGLVSWIKKLPADVEREKYKKYGRLYGSFEGNTPHLSVAEPDLIKDVMVKDFLVFHSGQDMSSGHPIMDLRLTSQRGESWKRVRSIISPAFTSGKLRMMVSIIKENVEERFLPVILEDAEHGTDVDFLKRYYQLILAIVARCVFGTEIENIKDENHPFIVNTRKLFNSASSLKVLFKRFFPKITKYLKIGLFPSDATDYLKDVAVTIMKQRKQMKQKGNDFLQLIMDAQEGIADMTQEDPAEQSHFDVGVGEAMHMKSTTKKKFVSEDEAIAQCVLFLTAGVDSTSAALAVMTYKLAINPDCQDKLIKEVDAYWERSKGELNLTELNSLPYLESFISECFRHNTTLGRLERVAQEDYLLGEKGIHVPKGTLITIPIAGIYSDPEWFPQPEKFDPERFSPEKIKTINPYIFLPFGAGPRNCIATRFALVQIKLCLVLLLKRIRFIRSANTKVPLEVQRVFVSAFPTSILLGVEKRNTTN